MGLFNKNPKHLSNEEQLNFFEIVSNFISVGLDTKEGIICYRDDEKKGSHIYNLCGKMLRDIDNGAKFSEAMQKYPQSFSPFSTGLISLAENTGKLGEVLREIVFRLNLKNEISQKVAQATLVPKISFIGIILVFVAFIGWVIPKHGESFYEMNMDLPLITQAVLAVGNAFTAYWYIFAALAIGAVFGYQWVKANRPELIGKFVLRLPFWRPVVLNQARYDFCTIMAICTNAGEEPVRSLRFTAMATDNFFLKEMIGRAIKHVESTGMDFDEALRREDTMQILDSKMYKIMKASRKTGNIGPSLNEMSTFYQRNLKAATDSIGDKIGMVTLVPVYALIMILIAAIALPVGQMASSFSASGF